MKVCLKFIVTGLLSCLYLSPAEEAVAAPFAPISFEGALVDQTSRSIFFRQPCDDFSKLLSLCRNREHVNFVAFVDEAIVSGWLNETNLKKIQTSVCGISKKLAVKLKHYAHGYSLKDPELFAFSEPAAAYTVAPELSDETLAINPAESTLALAEQVYLLSVREHLATSTEIALERLPHLVKHLQHIAIDDRSQTNRATFMVESIPQIQGVVPVIATYLKSVLSQIKYIDDNKAAEEVVSGLIWNSTVAKYSDEQLVQLKELKARELLAYSAFDGLFGKMTKPETVPVATLTKFDSSNTNALVSDVSLLHAGLGVAKISEPIAVNAAGVILSIGGTPFSSDADLTTSPLKEICEETAAFLAMIRGSQVLVKGTFGKLYPSSFNSSSL